MEEQLSDLPIGQDAAQQPFSPQSARTRGSASYRGSAGSPELDGLDSHTLHTALKYSRPSNQDEAFEMAQVASHYDKRATSGFGSMAGSYSAPDIRMSHDRGADGAAGWQLSNGDPHNYTVARAKHAEQEAHRIATNKLKEPYGRCV